MKIWTIISAAGLIGVGMGCGPQERQEGPTAAQNMGLQTSEQSAAVSVRSHFVDVVVTSGLDFENVSGSPAQGYIFETISAGAAFLDYDGDGYQDIAWNRGHLKFETEGPVAYYYDGPYPPESSPSADSLRHPLPLPEGEDAMTAISRAFVRAVAEEDDSHLLNTFSSSMNSLAAVLAANASDQLGGEKVVLDDFLKSERYARFRSKGEAATAPN